MTIDPFNIGDIAPFLKLAAAENWVAEPWEFEFLLAEFPQGCFAAKGDSGETAGFVTSLRHERSGWIGNLIVAAEERGRGIGVKLFICALKALRESGVETILLTASKSGRTLYEKYGFSSIDTIIRWSGTGRRRHAEYISHSDLQHSDSCELLAKVQNDPLPPGGGGLGWGGGCHGISELYLHPPPDPLPSREGESISKTIARASRVNSMDNQVWGDRRVALLTATAARGRLLLEQSGFAVIQPCAGAHQLGPFTAVDSGTAARIFDTALGSIPHGSKIYLDAPASNREALLMFNRKRLRISGTTELMYAGRRPDYRPELLYGLATMGSCG